MATIEDLLVSLINRDWDQVPGLASAAMAKNDFKKHVDSINDNDVCPLIDSTMEKLGYTFTEGVHIKWNLLQGRIFVLLIDKIKECRDAANIDPIFAKASLAALLVIHDQLPQLKVEDPNALNIYHQFKEARKRENGDFQSECYRQIDLNAHTMLEEITWDVKQGVECAKSDDGRPIDFSQRLFNDKIELRVSDRYDEQHTYITVLEPTIINILQEINSFYSKVVSCYEEALREGDVMEDPLDIEEDEEPRLEEWLEKYGWYQGDRCHFVGIERHSSREFCWKVNLES